MDEPATHSLPIFPLSNVVLFPTLTVPLHIFEPRYRQMTRDALAGDRRIGMVAVRPEHLDAMQGDPPVFAIGCEGVISRAAEQPDGTFNLLLTATGRFRIVDESPRPEDRLYRVARVVELAETPADPEAFRAIRGEVHGLLDDLLRPRLEPSDLPNALATVRGLDDAHFANALAQMLDFDPLEKQRLLEAGGQLERTTTLRDLLEFRLAESRVLGGSGTGRVH